MNKRLLLSEDDIQDVELTLPEDDLVIDIPEEPLPIKVEPEMVPEVNQEVVVNAYTDMLQDLLRKQWDVINSADSIIATIDTEAADLNKDDIKAILSKLVDDTTISIGMVTKALSVVDPSQEELMDQGADKAEEIISGQDKPSPEGVTFDLSDGTEEPIEVTVKDGEIIKESANLSEGHVIHEYKGYDLDWNEDSLDVENGTVDFTVEIKKDGKVISTAKGFKEARNWIDNNEESIVLDAYELEGNEPEDKLRDIKIMPKGKVTKTQWEEFLQKAEWPYWIGWESLINEVTKKEIEAVEYESKTEDLLTEDADDWRAVDFSDSEYWERFWLEECFYQLQYLWENAEDYADDEDVQMLDSLSTEDIKDVCRDAADEVRNSDYLWEEINERIGDEISDALARKVEEIRNRETVDIRLGNNEGE